MLIDIQNNRDWFYVMRLRPTFGYNYCGTTAFKLVFGRPAGGQIINGIWLWQAWATDIKCTKYAAAGINGIEGLSGILEVGICAVLRHLDEYYPNAFYRRRNSYMWGDLETMHNWSIQPVLDERLWQRYVDSRK